MLEPEVKGLVGVGESCGLVTRSEALKFLSRAQLRNRLETGAWVRVFPAVYRVVGAPETWRQKVEAALLWARSGTVLSHRTAAILHGFEQLPAALELTTTARLRVPEGVCVFRVSAMLRSEVCCVDGLDVTSVTRTLIDLASRSDSQTLHAVFSQALREKKTTLEKLEQAAARSGNRPGVIDVRALLHEFQGEGGPTESELEDRAMGTIVDGGLPRPKIKWVVVVGRKKRRLDLHFVEQGVVVETDGYAFHSGLETFEDDRERNNSLALRGLLVLHWTWQSLQERPEVLVAQLYAALNMRRG